jgi:hypothetical protein
MISFDRANDICKSSNQKSITQAHIIKAIDAAGFKDFVPFLQERCAGKVLSGFTGQTTKE